MLDSNDEYTRELRLFFDRLPKVPNHGDTLEERHNDIRKEWVVQIMRNPQHRYVEYDDNILRTILVGRVPEVRQWIKLVFIGTPESGEFLTACRDKRLNREYGGGPWDK